MADLFRSAFSYIQQAGSNGTSHPLVGTTVDVGGIKVKLRSLLAEGGFGLVFSAEDSQGNLYALKRLLAADKEAADAAIREIKFQKYLSGPTSIVTFVSAATRNPEQTSHGHAEFLLLTELCAGGPLIDMMQKGPISPENIFKIFYTASSAVKHMHDRNTPVTHRDIKIENLLFTSDGFIKLCDFGSATIEIWRPDDDWNALKRSLLEEEMQKHTTPMYRAPEILDTYQNYPIGPSQDIWALGCILFYLCYRTHPFEDSAKLRIINAKYVLPEEKTAYAGFHPIIKSLLQPNPHFRPSVQELCHQLEELAYHLKIDLGEPVKDVVLEKQPSPAATQALQPHAVVSRFVDFFSTLDWSSGQQQQQQQNSPQHQHHFEEIIPPPRPPPPKHRSQQCIKEETAINWERKAGIRVRDEEEDEDADLYKFDYEKKSSSKVPEVARAPPPSDDTEKLIDDLDELLDFAETPTLSNEAASEHTKSDDSFADMGLFKPTPKSEHGSGRSTPHNPAAGLPPMEQRSRPKPSSASTDFADLLADHGITEKKKATMGEMIRTEENKFLDPVSIKIRNWTQNKNGNIRALLSSLNEVLWPEAGNWNVPSITDMLNDSTVKKVYHRACILVHPDKQVGQPHHSLAQAIFTELNTAMKAFENNKK